MFKVNTTPLKETSDNLKSMSRRLMQEADTLNSVAAALRELSYLDEQRALIRKKEAYLNDKQAQMNQMVQALLTIAAEYDRCEERIVDRYDNGAGATGNLFTGAVVKTDFRLINARLKQMEVI